MRLLLLIIGFGILPIAADCGSKFLDVTSEGQVIARKWETPHIRWRLNTTNAPAGAQAIIQAAFNTWKNETSAGITDEYAGTTNSTGPTVDGYSDIFFNVSMSSIGADSGAIAVTLLNSSRYSPSRAQDETITEADILINPSLVSRLVTSTPTAATDLDLQEIITHELGHALGLAHSFLVDSIMYPSKPPSTADSSLIALFRVPKRSLAQDDIAWIEQVYPQDNDSSTHGQISGQIFLNGNPMIGAHVVAIKANESDLSFQTYPPTTQNYLVPKGMQNVSGFTENNGAFLIRGLKPGNYKVFVQGASDFMGLGYENITEFLSLYGTSQSLPLGVFQTSQCLSFGGVTTANFSDKYSAASEFSIQADQGYCEIEISATRGKSICSTAGTYQSKCRDLSGNSNESDGCSLKSKAPEPTNISFFIFVAFLASAIILRHRPQA